MAKIKLELKRKNDDALGPFGETVVTAMTDNANFTTPKPTLEAVTTAINEFKASVKHITAMKNAVTKAFSERNTKRAKLEKLLNQLAGYVEVAAEGDESKILSSGLQVRAAVGRVGNLPAPQNLSAVAGAMEGQVDLAWQAVPGSNSYEVDHKLRTDTATWERVKTVTASRMSVEGLPPGELYTFRVRAIGAAGAGPWSDEAVRRVP